jgi:hypothetical protein
LLTETYITSSCSISKGIVTKNGHGLFENDANIDSFLLSTYQHFQFNYPKFYKMDNLAKMGWLAAEVLLQDTLIAGYYAAEDVAVILANANSSLDDDIKYYESVKDVASPSLFVYTLPNIVIGEICIRNHFKGEQAFFIQVDFDADFIEQQVVFLLDNQIQRACICGWVDVLGEDYKVVLFLVEKKNGNGSILFSADNMNSIFNKV